MHNHYTIKGGDSNAVVSTSPYEYLINKIIHTQKGEMRTT